MINRLIKKIDTGKLLMTGIVLLINLSFAPYVNAQIYETSSGHVEFDSSVPLHSFTGETDHLIGQINLEDGTVDFYVDLTTVDTGIGARDKDMRETLETGQYPFAEFFGSLDSAFDESKMGSQNVTVTGDFTVHGVTKEVSIDGILEKTGDGLKVSAEWELNIRDYDIEPPGILFYRVSEIQEVRMEVLLTPKMSM